MAGYNYIEDSLVVTHPTTNSPACGLSTAERTGSPIFHTLWSRIVRENDTMQAIGRQDEAWVRRDGNRKKKHAAPRA
ncbi:hypothetical protein N7489_007807 [Penicillium chrysogenum]|uniref:uncharacterized protein n=1 Tax=Penicillium chrysogenum TaxID=5076 RepID=UPI0024DF22E0|nr:uncharacterized protein N7489_007807 [Penicillium chrysogenum]KAJ5237716.1 hypothetical protein N7489_007807 [Penicillium chrysogenum]